MTLLIILFIMLPKPAQEPVLTTLPMKIFTEIAQDNPYMTGTKSKEEIDEEWANYKS